MVNRIQSISRRSPINWAPLVMITLLAGACTDTLTPAPTTTSRRQSSGYPPPAPDAPFVLAGRVVDGDTGQAIAGANVQLISVDYPGRPFQHTDLAGPVATSGTSGTFALQVEMTDSWTQVRLAVSKGGFDTGRVHVARFGASTAELPLLRTLTMKPGDTIETRMTRGLDGCGDEGVACRPIMISTSPGHLVTVDLSSTPDVPDAAGLWSTSVFYYTPGFERQMVVGSGQIWVLFGREDVTLRLTASAEHEPGRGP